MLPSTVVDEHMTNMQPNAIVSADDPPDRLDLMIAAFQHGRLGDMLGDDASLYPLESIEGVKGYPPFFIFHGKDDSIVPTEGTEKFVKKLEQSLPGGKVLAKFPIGDHGFDSIIDLETPWLSEGLQFITAEWLG